MKKALLVVALFCASAQFVEAQVGRQRGVIGDYGGAVGYSTRRHGYGYGYGNSGGYGVSVGYAGSGFSVGTYYGGWYPRYRRYPYWGRPVWGYPYERYEPYEALGYSDYVALNYVAARRAQLHGVPERTQQITLSKELNAGVQRWKSSDYAGALASFKAAVGTDTSNGLAQVYMGLALVIVGDTGNAEKAIASGLPIADLTGVNLASLFVRSDDLARFWGALQKAPPLTSAVGLLLMGETEKARAKAADVQGAARARLDELLRARVTER